LLHLGVVVGPGRVGLLGFSLGGAVAATSARDPRIAALVAFYGFIPNSQRARIDRLPPLLVLHGDADDNVPLLFGQNLLSLAQPASLTESQSRRI